MPVVSEPYAPYELVKTMRASVLVLGGAGIATFGGLFGGGDRGPGQASDARPARRSTAALSSAA